MECTKSRDQVHTRDTAAAKSEVAPYIIEALTWARGGQTIKIEVLSSASGMVDVGPEPKVQRTPSNSQRNLKIGPRCPIKIEHTHKKVQGWSVR
jgi:hypothetical protein